jgi:ParB/RepB/Spo0J family partition protein
MRKLNVKTAVNDSRKLDGLDLDDFDVSGIVFEETDNLRTQYPVESLQELAESIRKNGQLQPVGIHRTTKRLVYGFRRYLAITRILKRKRIKIAWVDADTNDGDVLQVIENEQREDVSDLDLARRLLEIKKARGWTNKRLAATLAKSEGWIKRKIDHADAIGKALSNTDESPPADLVKLPTSIVSETQSLDAGDRTELLKEAAKNKLTKGQVRERVKEKKAAKKKTAKKATKKAHAKKPDPMPEIRKRLREIEKLLKGHDRRTIDQGVKAIRESAKAVLNVHKHP